MSVWAQLGDAEMHGRLLLHPFHGSVASSVAALITEVRAATDREHLRLPQERLLARLLEAERRYAQQSRLTKLRKGDPVDLMFWRRACVQLRAVGDAMAWKFLAYDRAKVVLLSRNQRPGLLVGKEGSQAEWDACKAHWEAGRPALMAGVTNLITASDLLIADGDTLLINEVKKGKPKMKPAQRDRMRALDEELRTLRISRGSEISYIVNSDVPLASYWSSADAAIEEALAEGVSTWVPTPGVALMFTAPFAEARFESLEEVDAKFAAVQDAAGTAMGAMTHRILVHSFSYPYRPNRAVPFPLLPIPEAHAAMLLSGEIVFTVELSVDRLVQELQRRGMVVQIVLDTSHDDLRSETPVLTWSRGDRRGIVHAGVVEQIGVELNDLDRWADAFAGAQPPGNEPRAGMYLCLANEEEVWA